MMTTAERRTLCVRVEATDGTVARVAAEYPHNLVMSNGEVYLGGQYTTTSTRDKPTEGGSGMIDFGFVDELSGISRDQIASQKWDNAAVYLFATDWAYPVEDEEELAQYIFGRTSDVDGRYTGQLMSLTDKMNQSTGRHCSPTCTWTFADYNLDSGDVIYPSQYHGCGIDKDGQVQGRDVIVTGSITEVTDNQQFRDANRTEPDDWFGNGQIVFTSGANAGLSRRKVKTYGSDGSMVCNAPFYYTPQVGDNYKMMIGCRRRPQADCTDKFNNRARVGAFGYVPTNSQVTKFGGQ